MVRRMSYIGTWDTLWSEEWVTSGPGIYCGEKNELHRDLGYTVVRRMSYIGTWELVSWCFEPSQPQRITSGLMGLGIYCGEKNELHRDLGYTVVRRMSFGEAGVDQIRGNRRNNQEGFEME